jgi:hypothetical protein
MSEQPVYLRIAAEHETPYFHNRSAAEAVISTIISAQVDAWMQLHGFVVMPEAVEMVLTPGKQSVTGLVAHLQAETIPLLAVLLPSAVEIWERRYQHFTLLTRRALDARLAMLLLAPVAGGIVDVASAYPYSSANPRYAASVSAYAGSLKSSTAELEKVVVA